MIELASNPLLTVAGSGASLVALVLTLLCYLRIRTVARTARFERDLIAQVLDLPDVRSQIKAALDQLQGADPGSAQEVMSALSRIQRSLELLWAHVFEALDFDSFYLCAARRLRAQGEIQLAASRYRQALSNDSAATALSDLERAECYRGLQWCHLVRRRWCDAIRVAKEAEQAGITACRSEKEIRSRYLVLLFQALLLWLPHWTRRKRRGGVPAGSLRKP